MAGIVQNKIFIWNKLYHWLFQQSPMKRTRPQTLMPGNTSSPDGRGGTLPGRISNLQRWPSDRTPTRPPSRSKSQSEGSAKSESERTPTDTQRMPPPPVPPRKGKVLSGLLCRPQVWKFIGCIIASNRFFCIYSIMYFDWRPISSTFDSFEVFFVFVCLFVCLFVFLTTESEGSDIDPWSA